MTRYRHHPARSLLFRRLLVPLAVLALVVATASGCSKKTPAAAKSLGIGTPLVQSPARNLQVAPGGKVVAFIRDVARPAEADAPEGVFQGVLASVAVDGAPGAAKAAPRALGNGVSTLEDGFRFSPDGRYIAFLQGFRFREQAGTLTLAEMSAGEAKTLGPTVRYYKFSPDGRWLGYVAAGHMKLRELSSGTERVVVPSAATFEFSHDSKRVLVRQQLTAGGALLLADVEAGDAEPRKVGELVGEYDFSPDGAHFAFTSRVGGPEQPYSLFLSPHEGGNLRRIGENVTTFTFSPDGTYLAYVDGQDVKHPYGDLEVRPAAGGEPKKVGEAVYEYRWSPSSQALVLREGHEDKAGRKWQVLKMVTLPGGAARLEEKGDSEFNKHTNYAFSADGKFLAFLKPVSGSIDLMMLEIDGKEPARDVAKGVFGYQFGPGDKEIWYRNGCVRGDGRECDLMAAPVAAPGPSRPVVTGIWNFKVSQNGERMLLTYPRFDTTTAADLGWMDLKAAQPSKGVDSYTLLGAQFLDDQGSKVVYLVGDKKREGVYAAELR